MNLKQKFDEYKSVLGYTVAAVAATMSVIAWGQNELQQTAIQIQAQESIKHDYFFQESRIARKEIEITEHNRELTTLLNYIGDDEPTIRQTREINYLDDEIIKLRQDIEAIKLLLHNVTN